MIEKEKACVMHVVKCCRERVAVCCSVLQCVAVCCSVLQCSKALPARTAYSVQSLFDKDTIYIYICIYIHIYIHIYIYIYICIHIYIFI